MAQELENEVPLKKEINYTKHESVMNNSNVA